MKSKLYNVTGVAFIPIQVAVSVSAKNTEDAKAKALAQWNEGRDSRNAMMIDGSEDHSSAFDFEPTEAIEQ